MDNGKIELIGASCGTHGPYTFYKAFKYNKCGKQNILALNEFVFIKLWSDSDLVSIGELQQLWVDRNSEQILASLRLYILPENTPEGRSDIHGEHEVLAISERVVIRCEDLLTWLTEDASWNWGLPAVWDKDCPGPGVAGVSSTRLVNICDSSLDFQDVEDERSKLDSSTWADGCGVVVLSFPRYCRYRGIMKRLEGVHNKWLRNSLVTALGGFSVPCRDTRVLFCKDTFDYPDLEGHELLCNHLAPKINLRQRRKRKKQSSSPGDSESNESESSLSTISSSTKEKKTSRSRNGLHYDLTGHSRRNPGHKNQTQEEKMFLDRLYRFMITRQTPITKVPVLGYKELDLYKFFYKVQRLGGYDGVTSNRLWKIVLDEMGGDGSNSNAATCARRYYERLLLPYERKLRSDAQKRACIAGNGRYKQEYDEWGSESSSRSLGNSMPLPGSSDRFWELDYIDSERRRKIILEGKTSSLRSVRLKTEKPSDLSGKENIPLSGMFRASLGVDLGDPSRTTHSPEVIVLDPDTDAPIKNITTPIVPALKKRKLDMLKEGGLEVTPIGSPGSSTASIETRTIKPSSSPDTPPGQVSIMVTPDLSHMLGSPKTGSPETSPSPSESFNSTPTHSRTVINVQDLKHPSLLHMYTNMSPSRNGRSGGGQPPPRVTQSRSIYAYSESTVYGNPKDCLTPTSNSVNNRVSQQPPPPQSSPIRVPPPKSSSSSANSTCNNASNSSSGNGIEVLDLRMKGEKPAVEIVRVPSMNLPSAPPPRQPPIRDSGRTKVPSPQVLPSSMGRTTVGSNLEITLVQNPKLALAKIQQEQRNVLLQQRRVAQQHAKTTPAPLNRPTPRPENGRSHTSSSSSSSSLNPSRSRTSSGNSSSSSSGLVIPSPPYHMGGSNSSSSKRRNSNDSKHRSRLSSSTPSPSVSAQSFLPGAAASLFPLLQNFPSGASSSGKNAASYLPQLDLYYQALYNSHGLYGPAAAASAAGFVNPLQMSTPQLYMPSEEHLQLYKNIFSQQMKPNPAQSTEDFARLLQDGSTSITLVGNSKMPTPK